MQTELIELGEENVSKSPLLEFARESKKSEESLPEPVWCVEGDGFEALWYPDPKTLSGIESAYCIQLENRSLLRVTLEFWKRYRSINPVERGRIVRYLDKKTSIEPDEHRKILSLIDVPPDEEWISVYRRISELSEPVKNQLRKGEIGPRLIRFITRTPDKIADVLFDRIGSNDLDFTVQQARNLSDTVKRLDDEKLEEFLDLLRGEGNAEDEADSPRDRGNEIIDSVRKLAYPKTEKRREEFYNELETLDLNGRVRVDPPKNFEGKYLEFSFRCERDESLQKFLEEIRRCQSLFEHV